MKSEDDGRNGLLKMLLGKIRIMWNLSFRNTETFLPLFESFI